MPSMTWLLESTSFSRGFLLRKIVGTVRQQEHLSGLESQHPFLPSSICFLLAGTGEAICSPRFLALARRNVGLLCHFA